MVVTGSTNGCQDVLVGATLPRAWSQDDGSSTNSLIDKQVPHGSRLIQRGPKGHRSHSLVGSSEVEFDSVVYVW